MTVFLKEYSPKFENLYWERLKDIDSEFQKKLLEELNLSLSSDNQFSTFRDLILASHERLQNCVRDLDLEKNNSGMWGAWKNLQRKKDIHKSKKKEKNADLEQELESLKQDIKSLKQEVKIFSRIHNYYDSRIKKNQNNVKLNLEILGKVHVCPYCNRDYINERNCKFPGGHLDHFFPRSKYPFFAICLYNLIPCCAICNTKKRTDDLRVSPFRETNLSSDFEFEFELNEESWEPNLVSSNQEVENDIEILGLREAYKIHKDELTLIAKKREEYSKIYEKHLSKILEEDLNNIYTSVEDLIFGEMKSCDSEHYKNTPLSYLKHQFYTYIESIHEEG